MPIPSAAGSRPRDKRRRPVDHRMASNQCRQPAIGHHPWHWTDHRQRDRRRGAGWVAVPIRPAIRHLARPDTEGAQQRRQGTARRDQQTGRRLYPQIARGWRHGGHVPCPPGQRQPNLGREVVGAQVGETRCRRFGQQNGAHPLGGDDARRELHGARRLARNSRRRNGSRMRSSARVMRRDDEPVRPGTEQTHKDQAPQSAVWRRC
jgi:hypothetical protein